MMHTCPTCGTVSVVATTRREDPHTSHAAARTVNPDTGLYRRIRFRLQRLDDMHDPDWSPSRTAWHIHQHLNDLNPCSPSGVRSRLAELEQAGWIETTGHTARLPTGRQARTYRLIR